MVWIVLGPDRRSGQFHDKATAQLPGLSLTLDRRFAHPFLAEYDRSLTVEQEGAGTTGLDLGIDTGGMTHVKVCRSRTGRILIHDPWETDEATRGRTRPSRISEPSLKDDCPEFLGAFDVDAEQDLSFRPS
ncbi:hypothetical protein [Methylobacterium soli]|uniref:Uncharacterized protein n=1 Tax=Methylobacterium soli TaxID=553447 RepID=A0A6L3T2H2_9HYPH|nr:hypothetical protein [Methylobacterium soli]KAB1079086.1 hypothetical protein F6X53_11950 [Methylobacterium soli]GJE45406.1 hypothetical protein AEGHOMDF_4601 [Methylobacterium soli]